MSMLSIVDGSVTSLVCLNVHGQLAARTSKSGIWRQGRQGAALNKNAFNIGCHRIRMYTMKSWCSDRGGLLRGSLASTTH